MVRPDQRHFPDSCRLAVPEQRQPQFHYAGKQQRWRSRLGFALAGSIRFANADPNSYRYIHAHPNANSHSYVYANPNGYSYCYVHTNAHGDGHSYSNAEYNTNTYAYSYTHSDSACWFSSSLQF